MLKEPRQLIIKSVDGQHKMEYKLEHRKNHRLKCLVPIDGKTGSDFEQTQTFDISKGGIGFISKKPIPVDEKIAMEIELSPDDEPVIVVGRVLWVSQIPDSDEYRIGMQFGDVLLDGSKERLKKYFSPEKN